MRERVEAARDRQRARFGGVKLTCNAERGLAQVRRMCVLDEAGQGLLKAATDRLGLTARAYHRLLKARTVADLAGAERPHSRSQT